ncbi:hypothetical protein ACI3QN_13005, partial [Propionibacterium freudenreichii]|uniref:hypothetical protein n=1 Tax=Propionibacterium freudenreichii TaxID=1744 RepID=UPI0038551197
MTAITKMQSRLLLSYIRNGLSELLSASLQSELPVNETNKRYIANQISEFLKDLEEKHAIKDQHVTAGYVV